MSYDIECPYCGHGQEICHDDGFGYEEDILHEYQCYECEKHFVFTTSIHFSYSAYKADCLNCSDHKWKKSRTHPKEFTSFYCVDCGAIRKPTSEEMQKIMDEQ